MKAKSLRTCKKGHRYHKTSDCPTCPRCEAEKKPAHGFLELLSAPARRALEGKGITDIQALAGCTEKDLLALHGLGRASIPTLRQVLQGAGLDFRR